MFKGGIQKGTVATDAAARKLDNQCKDIAKELVEELNIEGLEYQRKLNKDQIPGNLGACEPDGGAWFFNGELIAVFEAKKQQDLGNAIERWFKNQYICRAINPDVNYVTFCSGEGAYKEGVMGKALAVAHLDGFNKYVPNGNSCYMSKDGYTHRRIKQVMKKVILDQLVF